VDKDITHYVTNPQDRRSSIPVIGSLSQQLNLYDATFAISQGAVNGVIKSGTLYCQSVEKEKTKEATSYATLNNMENKDIKVYTIKK